MCIQELSTAIQFNLPVKIFILNNEWMGMVRQWQQLLHGERYSHSYSDSLPDFVKLAEAYGAVGIRCSDPAELDGKILEMINSDKVVVFDCRVEKHENCLPMIPSGKAHNEMIMGDEDIGSVIGAAGRTGGSASFDRQRHRGPCLIRRGAGSEDRVGLARLPVTLVWCEPFQYIIDAIDTERRIKRERQERGMTIRSPRLRLRHGRHRTSRAKRNLRPNDDLPPPTTWPPTRSSRPRPSRCWSTTNRACCTVVGLFAARGYNIESLTVAETDRKAHTSRITVVTRGTRQVLDQIEAQLNKVVNVRRVHDVTRDPNGVERELALVKVRGQGADRVEALRIAEIFRAKPVDTTLESFVFEISGVPSKIDKFLDLMRPLGLVELSRTGVLSIERGVEGM
jgi:acetolactate synthase-1/3 small subunit